MYLTLLRKEFIQLMDIMGLNDIPVDIRDLTSRCLLKTHMERHLMIDQCVCVNVMNIFNGTAPAYSVEIFHPVSQG